MTRRSTRQKASDLFRQSTPIFGKKGMLADVYPQIKDISVEVEEFGRGVDSWSKHQTYGKDDFPGEFVDCSNPACYGGGFQLGSPLARMVRERQTELEESKMCRGNEGSPKGRRIYRKCLNTFKYKINIKYKPERKPADTETST